jgi:hypothetical protein
MWLVLLESTKDRFLGVDSPGQHVPPCVRCGMSCLLTRIASGSVPCSVVRESVHGVHVNHVVQEKPMWGNLSKVGHTTRSKPFVMTCSDL